MMDARKTRVGLLLCCALTCDSATLCAQYTTPTPTGPEQFYLTDLPESPPRTPLPMFQGPQTGAGDAAAIKDAPKQQATKQEKEQVAAEPEKVKKEQSPLPIQIPKPPEKPVYPTVKVSGFFQADAGWFSQDATNRAVLGDIQNGADFRRARIGVSGDVAENVGYFLEYDFAFPGRPNFMDHYVEIRDPLTLGNVRAGYWRQPLSLDALTSVRELTFLERGLPFALVPFRQIGLGYNRAAEDGSGTQAVSVVRFPTDVYGGNIGDNGGFGVVSRLTSLPYFNTDDSQLLHLGAGYAFLDPANDTVFYRSQPEFFVAEVGLPDVIPEGVPLFVPFFVDTGRIAANHSQIFGAELAGIWHNWHAQSELIYSLVDTIAGPPSAVWGAYAQVGCILTGEHRLYNHKGGHLGRVIPREPFARGGGWGAWELALRWSQLDLNDGVIAGGRLNDLTAGLNWYLNQYTKFQFNYIHAFLDTPGVGASNADVYAVRHRLISSCCRLCGSYVRRTGTVMSLPSTLRRGRSTPYPPACVSTRLFGFCGAVVRNCTATLDGIDERRFPRWGWVPRADQAVSLKRKRVCLA